MAGRGAESENVERQDTGFERWGGVEDGGSWVDETADPAARGRLALELLRSMCRQMMRILGQREVGCCILLRKCGRRRSWVLSLLPLESHPRRRSPLGLWEDVPVRFDGQSELLHYAL